MTPTPPLPAAAVPKPDDPNDQTGPAVGIVAAPDKMNWCLMPDPEPPRETWSQSIDRAPVLTSERAAELLADDCEAEASEPAHRDPRDAATWHLPEREAAETKRPCDEQSAVPHVMREFAQATARAEKAERERDEWKVRHDGAQKVCQGWIHKAADVQIDRDEWKARTDRAEAALAAATAQLEAAEAACAANADAMLAATARAEKAEADWIAAVERYQMAENSAACGRAEVARLTAALAAAETSSLAARGWTWARRKAVYLTAGASYTGSARDRANTIANAERRTAVAGDSAAVIAAMVAELERLERLAGEGGEG